MVSSYPACFIKEEDREEVPEPSVEEAVQGSELLHWLELDDAEAFFKMISVDAKEYAKEHF